MEEEEEDEDDHQESLFTDYYNRHFMWQSGSILNYVEHVLHILSMCIIWPPPLLDPL